MDDLIEYINANRARYTREAIADQLMAAGHDRETVAKAWEASDAAMQLAAESAPARPRYGWLTLGLIVAGVVGILVVGGGSPYVFFVVIAYLIGAPICVGVGIGLVRLVDGGRWKVALGLIVGLIVLMLLSVIPMLAGGVLLPETIALSPPFWLLMAGLVALPVLGARMGAPREGNVLAYGLPIVGWLAATGSCLALAGSMS
ncbi:MAG: hypothetical protein ACRDFZ_03390 [Candidatus Limnocylindria bacterium]